MMVKRDFFELPVFGIVVSRGTLSWYKKWYWDFWKWLNGWR